MCFVVCDGKEPDFRIADNLSDQITFDLMISIENLCQFTWISAMH